MITLLHREAGLSPLFDSGDYPHKCMRLFSQIIIGYAGLFVCFINAFYNRTFTEEVSCLLQDD